ncbi:CRTAC1 family protein [Acidipila sp. EB88]|uniref:CRTAC1 family protein n=1 Tax=Acidipila sp. EB88 TaxID=2305226 RepID=UPI000F5E08DF|nr:CRTAC1 family protein [Acidipila sp. EB88]RRA48607.1 CRTAC1 family protein [Acidipila sp. EB88]
MKHNRAQVSRREMLWMAAGCAVSTAAAAQGVASRNLKPLPRGKASGLPFQAHFTDVAEQAGLTAIVVYGGLKQKKYIVETVGCGVAFLDYDNDGWLDIFVLGGTRMDLAPPDATNRLYKNNRDGTFTDVTEKAGLRRTGWSSGVTIGDYNNDGFEDIFITYYGQNVLYRNNGDGTFTDVTQQAGLLYQGATRWGSGCTFLDYDRDGHLDLFVANYVDLHLDALPKPGANPYCNFKGVAVNCGPRGLPMPRNYLYRNNGDGTFRDVSTPTGIAAASRTYAMTAVAADFGRSGWTDLYVASDSTPSLFFHNKGDGRFTEEGAELGVAFSADGAEQAGMGVAVGDYNLDGNLDIFKTHFADDTNVLYRNEGSLNFTDVTLPAGFGVETRYTSWGTGFADFDNNGWPDLVVATGSVYPEVEMEFAEYPLRTPRLIFRNLGDGRFEELFEEAGPGIAAPHCSRGLALGDFDNDGDVDMVIVNLNEAPSLLRNDVAGEGRWLKVLLVGTRTNRSAIGSTVIVKYGGKVQAQAVMAQSSFYSANDRRLHFGLGTNAHADLEIRWTNGLVEHYTNLEANQLITATEAHGIVNTTLTPAKRSSLA